MLRMNYSISVEKARRACGILTAVAIASTACASSSPSMPSQHARCDTDVLLAAEKQALKAKLLNALSIDSHSVEGNSFFAENAVFVSVGGLRPNYQDVVVYVSGGRFCGSGGCDAFIFKDSEAETGAKSDYALVGDITPARLPITLLHSSHNGWGDIGVFVAGGGIREAYNASLSYDGNAYDSNPTLSYLPKVQDGQVDRILIGKEQTKANRCRLI